MCGDVPTGTSAYKCIFSKNIPSPADVAGATRPPRDLGEAFGAPTWP